MCEGFWSTYFNDSFDEKKDNACVGQLATQVGRFPVSIFSAQKSHLSTLFVSLLNLGA